MIFVLFSFITVYLFSELIDSHSQTKKIIYPEQNWVQPFYSLNSNVTKIPILLYHNIDGKGPFSIKYDELKKHFDYFKQNDIAVISVKDMISVLNNEKRLTKTSVVITFDDGYKSIYTKLMPLAKEYNYPITVFVYTDFIYDHAVNSTTWKDLQELNRNNITVESHTISHENLLEITNRTKLYHELYLSRKIIEMKMEKKISMIAYPFGRYNDEIIYLSKLAGYTKVFSTNFGSNNVFYNNYCLNRHHVKSDYKIDKIKEIIYSK